VRAGLRRLLAGAALCAAAVQAAAADPAVIDDSGQALRLDRPAQRIISLSPGITELLFAAGAGARVVGVSEFSDFPAAALGLPRVARAQGIDLERIAALHPDLIVTWGSGYSPALLDALRRLGSPVYVVEPRTLESVASSLERLGALAGTPAVAGAATAAFRARLQALRARYAGRAPVRAFYQVWSRPVMTLSGQHIVSDVLRTCGARNVFAALAPLVASVDVEAVIAARPQVIITSESGGVDHGALADWLHYPQLPAVAARHLLTMDADLIDRAGPRILDAAQDLCDRIEKVRADGDSAPPAPGR